MTRILSPYCILTITQPMTRAILKAAFNMEPTLCHIQLYRS